VYHAEGGTATKTVPRPTKPTNLDSEESTVAPARPTVRIGLVGAGFAARLHVENYRRIPTVQAEIVAVTAAHPERARRFAEEFGIPTVHPTLDDLLADARVEVVDLCVPNVLHAPFAIQAARAGKHIIVEKPLTGFFGLPDLAADAPVGDLVDRQTMLEGALANADAILAAVREHRVKLGYAENWVYAPPIQKARRLLLAAGAAILRIEGEESHSGSHAAYSRQWRTAGGGSLLGKGCHPLGAALYLKYCEGQRRQGRPIRPRLVQAAVASLTKTPFFGAGGPTPIRTGYVDVEDWGSLLLTFEDGTVAQITASDAVLGGIRNYLAVFADRCVVFAHINPNTANVAYAPDPTVFGDEYITEKIETKAGWTFPAPDEDFITGYPQELQDFVEAVAFDREPLSGPLLARDVVAVIYGAYLAAATGQRVDLAPYLTPAGGQQ